MSIKTLLIYLNSILALRIFNLLLFVYLLTQLPSIFQKERRFILDDQMSLNNNESHLRWQEVNILAPPNLNQTILEAMRMNEWLAHPQYKCDQKIAVGGNKDSFHLCADQKFRTKGTSDSIFGKSLLITGRIDTIGQFEQAVNSSRWAVFLPQRNSALIDGIQNDVEIHYMSELEEDKYFPVDKIVEGIREQMEQFALAKLELYSPFLGDTQLSEAPQRLRQILQYLRAEQLLLVVQIEPESATEVLPLWYRLFYDLFMHEKYALLGAESNLACGLDLQYFGHCEYRVSFVKADLFEVELAPVFGLGSPVEEKLRLLNHLHKIPNPMEKCVKWKTLSDQLPVPCLDTLEKGRECSKMIYVRYRLLGKGQAATIAREYGQLCNLTHLIYPEPTEIRMDSSIQLQTNGISPSSLLAGTMIVPAHSNTSFWQLRPLSELISLMRVEPYLYNLLSLDLDGGEWTLLQALSTQQICLVLRRFEQILFRLRLWAIEEAVNYRRFYLWVLRFEECGFEKVISVDSSNEISHVTYRRIKIV